MSKRITGRLERTTVGADQVEAFVPLPLPPANPPLQLDGALSESVRRADHALSRLELSGEMVPSLDWFIYAYVRKEAVVSSQIEGTQATLIDLLNFEAQGRKSAPSADLEDICNFLDALQYARTQLADPKGLPLSMRLLNETHRRLMQGVRGADKRPGEVRRTQNWIGSSRPTTASHVPPPPNALPEVLDAFEKYLHSRDSLSSLIRAGLLHAQFETIHPYLDGNGRIGRLLVSLVLEDQKVLTKPLLYLSLFFKRNREEYFRRLNAVRREGDWEGWLAFFLDGAATIADEAVATAKDVFTRVAADRARVLANEATSLPALRLFEQLPRHPIVTAASVVQLLGTTKPTALRAIRLLEQEQILKETTGQKRDRSYAYQGYLDLLRVGTELESLPSQTRR